MMEDFIFYALLVGVSFCAGWYVREWSATLRVKSMLAELRENEDVNDASRVYATIELKDDMIFMYNKETNVYLGHSENFADLENMLKTKFPDTTFAISRDDMMKLMK
jgi:hypothetical protein